MRASAVGTRRFHAADALRQHQVEELLAERYGEGRAVRRDAERFRIQVRLAGQPAARAAGVGTLADVIKGDDPQQHKVAERRKRRAGVLTFTDLARRFMREKEARLAATTRYNWTNIIDSEIARGSLGAIRPEEITRQHIRELMRRLAPDRPCWAEMGVPENVAEAVLGHTLPRLVRTYNRHEPVPEMRSALEAWSAQLGAIVSGTARQAEVVAFARA